MTRKKVVAGNWKMNGTLAEAAALASAVAEGMPDGVDVVLCPPYPYLPGLIDAHADSGVGFGAQDVSEHQQPGAFTGEVSASMLKDLGCRYTLVGHSERREYHDESDAQVAAKFVAARAVGLEPILCVGETQAQRDAGETEAVIGRQLAAALGAAGIDAFAHALVAYEPVWAIGTGSSASPEQAQEVHAFIRSQLAKQDVKLAQMIRVIYGGSVKPANAADVFAQPDVDGGLIGGASLSGSDFLEICMAAR